MNRDAYQLQGQNGGKTVVAAGSWSGKASFLSVANDAVLATFTSNIEDADVDLVGITLPAGYVVGGAITSVSVTSGVVVIYY